MAMGPPSAKVVPLTTIPRTSTSNTAEAATRIPFCRLVIAVESVAPWIDHNRRSDSNPAAFIARQASILGYRNLAPDSGASNPTRPTLFEHWSTTVLEDRRTRRTELLGETETLIGRLRETLGLPPRDGDALLKSRLGQVGSEFLDTQALQATLSEVGTLEVVGSSGSSAFPLGLEESLAALWILGSVIVLMVFPGAWLRLYRQRRPHPPYRGTGWITAY